ncbi:MULTISPECIES: ACP S-malonyltransferase [Clostridium]|uniref:Malonyl CoA-acyl carrier protein transacylase n=1 Tax=Clostridium cibarium TaxID=2762247 RepID=A0ABR8PR28_9CLOT|nr:MULTISPECIES: ACP S-malonyltransferase [Clostridium]MBD7910539.1 ACP S-malonyltransferase [Clostridium cibarium]
MNNKVAFLFAGQGAQYVGMAKELYDNIPECKEIFDKGEEILKMPIKDLIFNGPEEELMLTENAQPAIVLTELAILKALKDRGVECNSSAGLSLGEYVSLINDGVLSFEDGLLLVKERGRIMGCALPKGLGKMAAIMRLDDEKVEKLISQAKTFGVCEGANYNCPGQVVIAGENEAIEKAVEIAKDFGGKGIELKVSGPFHSSLLKDASDKFYETIEGVNVNKLQGKVYSNIKGELYREDDDIRLLLKNHIMSPVYFEKIIRNMINDGVDTFVEIGPGKALRGFVKKIDRSANVLNVEDLQSLNNTLDMLIK